jgi:N-acetylmuramate 1-kinase
MQTDQSMRRIKNFLKHAGLALAAGGGALQLLAQGGSDRKFYRIRTDRGGFVLMTAPAFRYELRAFLDVGAYLQGCDVGIPGIIAHDDDGQLVLLEDVGDDSLYVLLQRTQDRGEVVSLYRQVLAALARLQMKATPHMTTCNYLRNRTFGYEALRWETDYFIECFVRQYCGLEIEQESSLDDELHRLATTVAGEPRCFMHRDFQSKNIHFKDGRVRIIDFQTATCGLMQYDLASLLKDAYAPLAPAVRKELLVFYLQELAEKWGRKLDPAAFTSMFHRAGLQRTMQALGAFAFLSMRKGKKDFEAYIPAGIANLREALALFPEYPVLAGLTAKAVLHLRQAGREEK